MMRSGSFSVWTKGVLCSPAMRASPPLQWCGAHRQHVGRGDERGVGPPSWRPSSRSRRAAGNPRRPHRPPSLRARLARLARTSDAGSAAAHGSRGDGSIRAYRVTRMLPV